MSAGTQHDRIYWDGYWSEQRSTWHPPHAHAIPATRSRNFPLRSGAFGPVSKAVKKAFTVKMPSQEKFTRTGHTGAQVTSPHHTDARRLPLCLARGG